MSEQDPLKEDSNSNFTEIPVIRLSLLLIGNKMVEAICKCAYTFSEEKKGI
jgi:hypothetical protein